MKFLIICFIFAFPSVFAADNAINLYATYSPKIVQILTKLDRSGTGFFISPEVIITNRHVVLSYNQEVKKWDAPKKILMKNGLTIEKYKNIICSMRVDLCVIVVEKQKSIVDDSKISNRAIIPGEDVFAVGHPAGVGTPIITSGIISSEEFEIPGLNYKNEHIKFSGFTTNTAVSQGSSGSPLLSKTGELLGVAVSIHRTAQNLNIIISSSEINLFAKYIAERNTKEVFGFEEGFDTLLTQETQKHLLVKESEKVVAMSGTPVKKIDHVQDRSDEIRNVLKEFLPDLKVCYDSELKLLTEHESINLTGNVKISFKISRDGSVQDAEIISSDLVSENLNKCMSSVITKAKFVAVESGEYINVVQPFYLRAVTKSNL